MREEQDIYQQMWRDFSQVIETNQYKIDPLINNPSDTRRGITALSYLRHSEVLTAEVSDFLQQIKVMEPEQYYQPVSDLHLTVLSIVTCRENYSLSDSRARDYAEIFKEAVQDSGSFDIHFRGITATPDGILLQGFMPDELLADVREKLRVAFKNSLLDSSIDSRYKIATAHSTIVRFIAPLRSPHLLFERLKHYRDYEFGTHSVDKLELVFNNWYQQQQHTRLLAEAALRPGMG